MSKQQEQAKAIAILAVTATAIIVVFVAGKNILEFLGLKDSPEDKEKKKEQEKIIVGNKEEIEDKKNKGESPSYLDGQYNKSAQIIQNATNKSALDDQNATAIQELLRYTPKDIDYLKLQDAFGSREHYWFGVSRGNRTLVELLQSELSSSEKNKINATWRGRKMKSRIQ